MANKVEALAFEIGDEIANNTSTTLVDANYKKEAGKYYLRLFIDKPEGVGIDDCEAFSRAFEERFDLVDPTENEYILEVSSPGLDRKLKTEREFRHFSGRQVDVKLFSELDGRKEFEGILGEYENGKVQIICDSETIALDIKNAAYIKLHFEF